MIPACLKRWAWRHANANGFYVEVCGRTFYWRRHKGRPAPAFHRGCDR